MITQYKAHLDRVRFHSVNIWQLLNAVRNNESGEKLTILSTTICAGAYDLLVINHDMCKDVNQGLSNTFDT